MVSLNAPICPSCGAPFPYKARWDGYGYEYRTKSTLFGVPLLHVSFKYRQNRMPVVARGIIAVGQFGFGVVNISQFGVGLFSVSQITLAGAAVAQFAVAGFAVCQFGIAWEGIGQCLLRLSVLFF